VENSICMLLISLQGREPFADASGLLGCGTAHGTVKSMALVEVRHFRRSNLLRGRWLDGGKSKPDRESI
jgi:hypothetical protein